MGPRTVPYWTGEITKQFSLDSPSWMTFLFYHRGNIQSNWLLISLFPLVFMQSNKQPLTLGEWDKRIDSDASFFHFRITTETNWNKKMGCLVGKIAP